MKNEPERHVKRKPGKVRGNPRPPFAAESPENMLLDDLHTGPLVQVVLDSLAHPLYVIDVADYHVSLVNRAAREAYVSGGATCYTLTHHRDRPCHSEEHPCPIEIIKETGAPTVVEHIHYDKNGTPRNVEVHAFPIFDEAGTLVQIIEYTVDITARKQAEEALHQSERRFRGTFENAPVGIAHIALDGQILRCNSRFCEIVGCPRDGFNATCEGAPFAEDREAERVQIQRLLDGEVTHYSIEKRYVHRNGGPVWVNLTRSIQRDEAGREEYFIVVIEDISERKRAAEALRQAEQRFRTIFDTTSDGIFLHDLETRKLVMCNKSFLQMLGYTDEEFAKLSVADLHPEADLPFIYAQIEQFLAGAKPIRHDIRFRRKDGSVLFGDVTPDLVQLDGKRYVVVALKDITERKRMEEELRQHAEHLEELVVARTAELRYRTRQLQKLTLEMSEAEDRERERLAHILHDDLQQELAAAKFHLSIARSRARHDPSVQEITLKVDEMLKDAIGKSRSLSHELSPVVLHQGDFAEALQWLADEIQAKHGLVVRVHGRAYSPSAPIKAFLYRAAQELLFNAVKHAQVPEARVRVRQCGGSVCLSVSDRGRGFDPDELRETAGFGLLSIRERIELLGGRMKIRSAPGQGSTFLVVVPDGTQPEDRGQMTEDGRKTEEGSLSAVPRPPSSVLRVVLADDHEIVRQGLISLLSDEHDVEIVGEAANGREAVDLATRLEPDLVIMDVSMPIIGGEEATRRIKQNLPETRIVSLSMREEPEVRQKMQEAGADSYVLKTAPYKELLAAIRGRESDS